ncbi:phosphatidylethanolamine-binding protein [Cercophora samala]|uniref:Phosphatidylethanolamine-binding protein n=1 Tax=Cercophora samala TaxID=330535 RepID=A0AA39ZDP1_9PEZI|nr:phosphatidylethanolamine-binding protein [Cercophora samala]
MYPTLSKSLPLSLLALASVSLADDNAESVSTLSFKNAFVNSGIVPEVIPALDPAVSFYATYKTEGDSNHSELLIPGSSLTVNEISTLPIEFSVENLSNATNITAQTRYLIYLLDADAPARSNPTARNLRHWLAGNFTLNGQNSSVLSTAQRLARPPNSGAPFTNFTAPRPDANSGVHRYIMALYTQPARFNTAGFESVGMEREVANWNLSRWRTQLGLGPAIGATYFVIDTGANGGNGTSAPQGLNNQGGNGGNNNNNAGGQGGNNNDTSAAADIRASSVYVVGLTALAAVFGGLIMV